MKVKEILETAIGLVCKDRKETHGPDMRGSFERTAKFWSAYLDVTVTAEDVAIMMVQSKMTRAKDGQYNPDDYVDMCGYGAIAGQLADKSFEPYYGEYKEHEEVLGKIKTDFG